MRREAHIKPIQNDIFSEIEFLFNLQFFIFPLAECKGKIKNSLNKNSRKNAVADTNQAVDYAREKRAYRLRGCRGKACVC